jgi:phosphoribosylformylglycinamidine synthase subunit PurL
MELLDQAFKLGLTREEFGKICSVLGRNPNFTELAAYSGMWSEHCSYKNSIRWLKTLPREGDCLLAGAGEENAGLVDLGDGIACAFKIESHNHPSAIEPYQGAATGVGGINRDIFTMGARPIAQLNALFFGNPSEPKTKWLLNGVVKGIGDYGNAFGVPTVSGQTFFDDSFFQNPLVNAMSAGIVEQGKHLSAIAKGNGNPVYIVGSATGKDGIHGASFASGDLTEESVKKLPSVQVGDPFQEKLLLEATLEVAQTDAIVGIQDMGAAGVICSTAEMSAKGDVGMDIYLDQIPVRQKDMKPFELLLSESQERMLIVAHKGKEKIIEDIFNKWDLPCARIGEVTEGGTLRFYMHGECVAEIPAESLVLGGGAPVYEREYQEPDYKKQINQFSSNQIPVPKYLNEIARKLIVSSNLCSRNYIINQYDSMVGAATLTTNKPSDAGVVRIPNSDKALALTVDVNPRYVYSDPEAGTMHAVAEAARNLVCSGAKPLAITNCLNFGNPYNPEAYWQFVGAIKGMGKACRHFNTPVTGGNVSFYNQFRDGDYTKPVAPSPSIGMIGIMNNYSQHLGMGFKSTGKLLIMLGKVSGEISCSEYLKQIHGVTLSPPPPLNLQAELRLHKLIFELNEGNLIDSAHDVSEGGLFFCLLESAFVNSVGFSVYADDDVRQDGFWFGEAGGRIVISLDKDNEEEVVELASSHGVEATYLGETIPEKVLIEDTIWGTLEEFRNLHSSALNELLNR